jgi:two-component system, chemotaxis family, sensor kinase CheA
VKSPGPGLFSAWPGDAGRVERPHGPFDELVTDLLVGVEVELGAAVERAASPAREGSDEEDALDRLYRRGQRLAGLAALFGVPKLDHLLALLAVTLDVGRHLRGFERFSLAYVVRLLAGSTRQVAEEFRASGASAQELEDVVQECSGYIRRALAELAPEPPSAAAPAPATPAFREPLPAAVPEPGTAPAPILAAAPPLPEARPSPFDDGPEELNIPSDKIGLISDFCEEARENIERIGRALIELERSSQPAEIVNELFRAFHTVKGGSRMLRIAKMERLGHALESCLEKVRAGSRAISPALVDTLLAGRDVLAEMVEQVASRGPVRARMAPVLALLDGFEDPTAEAAVSVPVSPAPVAATAPQPVPPFATSAAAAEPELVRAAAPRGESPGETIRIATEKLDAVLNTASEIFISRIRIQNETHAMGAGIRELSEALARGGLRQNEDEFERRRRRDERMLQDVRDVVAGRDHSREQLLRCLERVSERLAAKGVAHDGTLSDETGFQVLSLEQIRKRLEKNVEHLEQLSSRLQNGAMSFRMVPIASLFSRFPTQVRSLARQLGKTVRLDIEGEDTQLDKVLIGHLADPLLHLLRNSLDHGLESASERLAAGKPETGRILLRASYQGSYAVIEIADDGRGIDTKKVLARAIERGLVDSARASQLELPEILAFIFEPGFSTAEKVSEMSGRGVGMDVVRSSIHQIQGTVALESEVGQGTRVTIRLPLTLAVIWIVLVEEGPHRFAFPLLDVNEIVKIHKSEITQLSSGSVCSYRGKTLPLSTLSSLLGFPPSRFPSDEVSLVILSEGGRQVGIVVEAVVGRQEVLIKNLGGFIRKVPFVIGCTILSDSRLVLILNPREVLVSATSSQMAQVVHMQDDAAQDARHGATILVVDDSPIQRKHLRGVLEGAGYAVTITANGFEALKQVGKRHFAAALVDIVMPLMDGFEFVEKTRQLRDGAGLPVFFVTSRRNQEDRERARLLGALDYFEKPVDPAALIQALDQCRLAHAPAAAGALDLRRG